MHDYDPLHSPSAASRAIGDALPAGSLATSSSSSERRPTSGPNASRNRACARANWDFEKLTVRPKMRAISACVYPSTSYNHTTLRVSAGNSASARSRSLSNSISESVLACSAIGGAAAESSSSDIKLRCHGERRYIKHLLTAMLRTQPAN